MNEAKIHLSKAELELVQNAGWILTKNGIIEKVKVLLSELQDRQMEHIRSHAPVLFPHSHPKISRGENYKGLPYLVLDYPRFFGQESIFAIRTMFWWGHFFSVTLQLSGDHKHSWEENIIRAYPELISGNYFHCIKGDPWEHHFEPDYYREINLIPAEQFEKEIRNGEFIKLAAKLELDRWEDAPEFLFRKFTEIINWLKS